EAAQREGRQEEPDGEQQAAETGEQTAAAEVYCVEHDASHDPESREQVGDAPGPDVAHDAEGSEGDRGRNDGCGDHALFKSNEGTGSVPRSPRPFWLGRMLGLSSRRWRSRPGLSSRGC